MTTINQLSAMTAFASSDKLVVWQAENGDTRSGTVGLLADYVATVLEPTTVSSFNERTGAVTLLSEDLSPFIGDTPIAPGRVFRKSLRHTLAFKFADYATIVSTYGYTFLYPQGACVDGNNLYVTYASGGGTSGIGWNWIAVYNWTTGAYLYCFSAGSVVGEGGGAVITSGGTKYFIGRDASTSVSYFDVTSVTNLSRLTAARTEAVERTLQVSLSGTTAITSDRAAALGTVIRRNRYKLWDTSTNPWTLKSKIEFPFNDIGQYGDSTESSTTARPLPKTQGVAFGNGWFAHGLGGYYAKAATVYPYNLWGIRAYSDPANKIADGLCDPAKAIAVLEAAGVVCTQLESEGVFTDDTGSIYSLSVTQTYSGAGATTGGIVILEEMSADVNALDFTACAANHVMPNREQYSFQFPASNGKLIDPYRGTEIATMEQMCDFLLNADLSQTSWYSSSITGFTGIDGSTYANGQRITVYNPNNSSFIVELAPVSAAVVRRYRIIGTAGSRAEVELNGVRLVTSGASATANTFDGVVVVNKTVGSATGINLPASPVSGQRVAVKDGKGDAGANNITITPNAGTIDGAANKVISANYGAFSLIYNGTEWNVI